MISELRKCLVSCAQAGTTIIYKDLAEAAQVPAPHRIHNTTLALEEMVRDDHAAGRPLLAALAVSRGPEGIPGRGFFHLLTELGRYSGPDQGSKAQIHHNKEKEQAIAYWAQPHNNKGASAD